MNDFDDLPHTDDYYVSTDKTKLDHAFVIREVRASYWGGWRTPNVIMDSIYNSMCFGLYHHGADGDRQVGFARVVTDYCTIAWICDVLVCQEHQGKGLGKFLLRTVMDHPDVEPRSCVLTTRDAQELYAKFGFKRIEAMKRLPQ